MIDEVSILSFESNDSTVFNLEEKVLTNFEDDESDVEQEYKKY